MRTTPSTRAATPADLDAIVELTRAERARLALASPTWWSPAAGADDLHRFWLEHLVTSDGPVARVVMEGEVVVGCAFALPQGDLWFVDDVALAGDDRWAAAGATLLASVTERPAITCAASGDEARLLAAEQVGLRPVSAYWLRSVEAKIVADAGTSSASPVEVAPIGSDRSISPGPLHTFGGALDPHVPGALSFAGETGYVVGSPSVGAPPVYDPGGTVAIVDRIVRDRARLLEETVEHAARRGDVAVNVVVGNGDHELEQVLEDQGFTRTVEVLTWPT